MTDTDTNHKPETAGDDNTNRRKYALGALLAVLVITAGVFLLAPPANDDPTPPPDATPEPTETNTPTDTPTVTETPTPTPTPIKCNDAEIRNEDPGTMSMHGFNGSTIADLTSDKVTEWRSENTNNDSLDRNETANAYARLFSEANANNQTTENGNIESIGYDCPSVNTKVITSLGTNPSYYNSEQGIADAAAESITGMEGKYYEDLRNTTVEDRWDQIGVGVYMHDDAEYNVYVTVVLVDTDADTSTDPAE